jgi:Arc/MetJ-type ribon-helix-helix transcriptional regulator
MTVVLASDVEHFLEQQVRAGCCNDTSELVNDIVRSFCRQQNQPFSAKPELESWLLESVDQATTPLTDADFDGIRQRIKTRYPATHS